MHMKQLNVTMLREEMMSYESADDLKFYVKKGYCPGNAGKTLEWAFKIGD